MIDHVAPTTIKPLPGIHAREWIAPAVAAYVIQQLSESKEAHKYIDKFNFYLLPVANPDGYEYTRQSVIRK